jgi:hypothetical protein
MPARARFFAKQTSKKIPDLKKFMSELPERTEALRGYLPMLSAKYVLKEILERIPKRDEWKTYRQALMVSEVLGAGSKVFAVHVDQKHRKVKKVDPPKTILYVKAKRGAMRRPKPEIALLEQYNPWTYDTIPFVPDKREATVIIKKADLRQVQKVEQTKKRKHLKRVRVELARMGRREVKKKDKLKVPKNMTKVPTVIFEALKLEFGLGPGKSRPHWAPSIRLLLRSGLRQFRRSIPQLTWALTRADFRGWRKWPPKTRRQVRMGDAKRYLGFQKRLGIRASG